MQSQKITKRLTRDTNYQRPKKTYQEDPKRSKRFKEFRAQRNCCQNSKLKSLAQSERTKVMVKVP